MCARTEDKNAKCSGLPRYEIVWQGHGINSSVLVGLAERQQHIPWLYPPIRSRFMRSQSGHWFTSTSADVGPRLTTNGEEAVVDKFAFIFICDTLDRRTTIVMNLLLKNAINALLLHLHNSRGQRNKTHTRWRWQLCETSGDSNVKSSGKEWCFGGCKDRVAMVFKWIKHSVYAWLIFIKLWYNFWIKFFLLDMGPTSLQTDFS